MTELSTSAIEWCITNCDAYVYSEEARKELAALIEAAEPVTPADATCTCGHLWSAHNDLGCCWDDECPCSQPRR